jgi:excisionase family DNA binding protein
MSYYSLYAPLDCCVDVRVAMSYLDELFDRYPVTMSVPQVAEVLGRPHSTVYKWLGDGTIPGSKVGESWVIYRDEVKAIVAAGRNLIDEHGPK